MAVELWIDDGNPWYLSPDIWTRPAMTPTTHRGCALRQCLGLRMGAGA